MADAFPSAGSLLNIVIGENVAAYREALGLTQAQAAARASILTGLWSRIEIGRADTRLKTPEKVAVVLQVAPALLFDLDSSEMGLAYRNAADISSEDSR